MYTYIYIYRSIAPFPCLLGMSICAFKVGCSVDAALCHLSPHLLTPQPAGLSTEYTTQLEESQSAEIGQLAPECFQSSEHKEGSFHADQTESSEDMLPPVSPGGKSPSRGG